ncbi:DUF2795 domain-containing protein [Streptomyces mayteni]
MQQRGSNRLNVIRDDLMKHDLQGLLRSEHPTRAEEWRDQEPAAEDDPALLDGPVPRTSAGGPQEAEDEAFRFELARHLRRSEFPADRRALLRTLAETYAPDDLVETVRRLPTDRTFVNVQEVTAALGRRPAA